MKQDIIELIRQACQQLFDNDVSVILERPEEQFGDFATNVAMQLAKPLARNPREIAHEIAAVLRENDVFKEVGVAGPGFINMTLSDTALVSSLEQPASQPLQGMKMVVEYSDPNPFKVLHAGHFYTSVVGDAISNLLERQGAAVHRVNFGGDVGLHVAKAMWGIIQKLGGENPAGLDGVTEDYRSDWISEAYVAGNAAYESGEAKEEIVTMNKKVYTLHSEKDHTSAFAQIYWTCREWSYQYFNSFYNYIGTVFEKYYPESSTAPIGLDAVQRELKNGIYEESDGAIIFDGEKHDLHKRVFINSNGLPTYEAKDVGLALSKWRDYTFDVSVMITGNDIVEYMKVVLKSIEQFEPEIAKCSRHITHGMVKLKGGQKMSSRLGNFLKATDVLEMVQAQDDKGTNSSVLAAIKYGFLKQAIGQDILFDPKESTATEGNSGPYLQYAHARACSVVAKSEKAAEMPAAVLASERTFVRKLSEYEDVLQKSASSYAPHLLCQYLFELAQVFNRFYENNRVIDDPREAERLYLVSAYTDRLREGLNLLGIHAPEKM